MCWTNSPGALWAWLQEKAKDLLRLAMYADSRKEADQARTLFAKEFGEKHEKAVACLLEDWDELLTFLNIAAEHWLHFRSSNVIENNSSVMSLQS